MNLLTLPFKKTYGQGQVRPKLHVMKKVEFQILESKTGRDPGPVRCRPLITVARTSFYQIEKTFILNNLKELLSRCVKRFFIMESNNKF